MKHKIIIQTVLPNAMKLRPPGPEFLAQLRDFINDPANSKLDREMMLGALGEVQSPALAPLLHELYGKQTDPQLRAAAAGGLAMLGAPDGRGPQEQREQSTVGLELIWRSPTSDKDMVLLRSLANGIAVGGAGSGIELLLQAALAPAGKDDARKTAALGALHGADILNSHAVPPLAARLSADNPTGEASKLARDVLLRMVSTPDAARALVAWMQTVDANTTPMARDLVLRTENPEIWQAALNPAVPFRSEAVREAIRAGLAERRAGISVGYPAGTRRGN